MSSIGYIIKQERLNQNIKQTVLARGICSTSYLSKIENNSTVPSEDVINLLLERLNLEIDKLPNEEENKFIDAFYELYKDAIIQRDKKLIRATLHEFSVQKTYFLQLKNYYTYNLYMFRLMLILNEKKENLQSTYAVIIKSEDNFDEKQRFIRNLNLGLYYYLNGDYYKALSKLESSLKFVNNVSNEEWEIADFHNVLSLIYFRCNDFFNTINHATKSLNFYKDNLLFERAIDCYIVIGASHKKMRRYKEAEKNYNLAKKLVIDYKVVNYEGMIYQNIGSLYAIQEDHDKAIEYYKMSLKSKEENYNVEGYLITILSIIKEYSKQNNHIEVLSWCKKGFEAMEDIENKNNTEYHSYYCHLEIYRALHSSTDELESVLKKGINYFELVHDDRHVQKYSILLANYYFKESKFKAADLYYQKAIQMLFKQNFITKWEDL
ncbi:tetratricopeptide repeat protein [Psychrobacillus sp. OK032]|uniref:tetratricopeptide repeat protein n=1 Tax=Psychrobacillus sp. OK032 TaxID=1884358 RepID=UPI0008D88FB8|nr:tetratricopeptide repeat protein [Psychrobacillus sp. OK032]SES10497.1 Tetratricopeptide repeat-containing protein [Psychrobacillus sp. OK032]